MGELIIFLLAVILFCTIIWATFWLFISVPAQMAAYRGRSKFFWVVFGFCTSPFVSIILLWMLGDATGHVRYDDELDDQDAAKGGQ